MLDQTIREHIRLIVDWDQVRFLAGPLQSFHRVGVAQFDLTLVHLGYKNKIGIMSTTGIFHNQAVATAQRQSRETEVQEFKCPGKHSGY